MLSSLRQVTLHSVKSKTKKNIQESIFMAVITKKEMADAEAVTHVIKQAAIETVKAAVQTLALAGTEASSRKRSMAVSMGTKPGVPYLKQPSFDFSTRDVYTKPRNFQMEESNIILTYNRKSNNEEKGPIFENWLCRDGLHFIQILKKTDGLFGIH